MLKKLLEKPSNKILYVLLIVSLVLFIILTIFFQVYPVNTNMSPYGILDFELAFSSESIKIIFTEWNTNPVIFHEQLVGVYVDFVYIISYVLMFDLIMLLLIRKFDGRFQNFSLLMMLLPVIAGICDVIENIGLLNMLNTRDLYISGSGSDIIPFMTSTFATTKFMLLILSLIFIMIELTYLIK